MTTGTTRRLITLAALALALPAALGAQTKKKRVDLSDLASGFDRSSAVGSGFRGGATVGTPISVGTRRASRLDSSDPAIDEGTYGEAWSLTLRAGQQVVISMRSEDVDAFLGIGRESTGEVFLVNDDESGESVDAQLTFEAPSAGEYMIVASSFGAGTGDYTIEVAAGSGRGNALRFGQSVYGTLTNHDAVDADGSVYDSFTFEGNAGDRVAMSMVTTSDESPIDPMLSLRDPSNSEIGANDDGPWDNLDSYLEITLPRTGRYTIVLRSFNGNARGEYRVLVTRAN